MQVCLLVTGCCFAVQIDLSNNALCGIRFGQGTYTADGIKAIAESIRVSTSLTSINLSYNNPTNYGRDMTGIKAIADALVEASLTSFDLHLKFMGDEGKALLRKAVEGRSGFKCHLNP